MSLAKHDALMRRNTNEKENDANKSRTIKIKITATHNKMSRK
jgi:hypothetical protein